MQLLTEPHNRHHHLLDTQGFYLNDSTLGHNNNYPTATHTQPLFHQDAATKQANHSIISPSEISNQNPAIATTILPHITSITTSEDIPLEEVKIESGNSIGQTELSQSHQDNSISLGLQTVHITLGNNNNEIQGDNNLATTSTESSSHSRMNIQPTGFTKNHMLNNGALSASDELSIRKRREDLSRRPSYRKIFNDLTGLSGPVDTPPVAPNSQMITNIGQLAPPTAPHRQSPQQSVTNSNQPHAVDSSPSPQALDMLSSAGMSASVTPGLQNPSVGPSQSPVSVVDLQISGAQQLQQASHQHQHHHLPPPPAPHVTNDHHHQQARHHHQQQQQQQHHHHHQLPPPPPPHHPQASQIHQVHHMMNTAISPPITGKPGEEVNKKRELRLQKNREAAKECRRKKKEYIKRLEERVTLLDNQNKLLIEELKTLKDLYCKSTNE